MEADKQWRIETGEFLKGATLQWQQWKPPNADWDHDHCACCWAKFAEWDGPEIQRRGYTTTSQHERGVGYYWVCEKCFADLRHEMEWRLVPAGESGV